MGQGEQGADECWCRCAATWICCNRVNPGCGWGITQPESWKISLILFIYCIFIWFYFPKWTLKSYPSMENTSKAGTLKGDREGWCSEWFWSEIQPILAADHWSFLDHFLNDVIWDSILLKVVSFVQFLFTDSMIRPVWMIILSSGQPYRLKGLNLPDPPKRWTNKTSLWVLPSSEMKVLATEMFYWWH